MNDGENKNPTAPARIYRSIYIDLWEDERFRELSRSAREVYTQAHFSYSCSPLGISRQSIFEFHDDTRETPYAFKGYIKECQDSDFMRYDQRTAVLWLPRYFDFALKPHNSLHWRGYLERFFHPLPASQVKTDCASMLRARAKVWGETYEHVASASIGRVRAPEKRKRCASNLTLVPPPARPKFEDKDE